ncbi:unnamed protein product [Absidia cylindrospora]
MFGDDIPSDILDQMLDIPVLPPPQQRHSTNPTTSSTLKNIPTPSYSSNTHNDGQQETVPTRPTTTSNPQQPSCDPVSSNNNIGQSNGIDYDDNDDMFGDDIPIDLLDEPIATTAVDNTTNGLVPIKPEIICTTEESVSGPSTAHVIPSIVKVEEPELKTKYKRYSVVYIQMKTYVVNDTQLVEKELLLVDQNHEKPPAKVYLRQDWIHSQISEGDIINICFTSGTDQTTYSWIIDNDHNFLIHYPDRLVSCTAVAESFFCLRKSVLQMTTKGVSDFSEPLVHGAIIHETLQYCLKHKNFTTGTIQDALKRTIKSTMDSLYVIRQDEMTAYGLLEPYVKSIQSFGSIYVGDHAKAAATVKRDMGPTTREDDCSTVAIRDILDIEEHIWSSAYGLKGMIDATVEMVLSPSKKILTLPFELKTGKVSRNISHRAQTILYTLLMGDRYDVDITTGVLYYSKTNSFYMVPASRSELRSLIMARNDLAAAYQRQATVLPPMIKNFHSCQYCAMNDACVIYHKTMEGGSAATSGLGQWFDDHTVHLDDDAMAFYRHWVGLIAMEEKDLDYLRKDIWNESPQKREIIGKCLKNMVVASTQNDDSASNWYTFRRHTTDPDGLSLLNSSIMVGDTVVVSSMQGDLLLGTGFVMQIDTQGVTVSLNTPLRHVPVKDKDFDHDNHQVFKKWWTMQHNRDTTTYRLDKDEAAGGFALMKSNLVALMTNNPSKKSSSSGLEEIHTKLRQLIVESRPPRFARLDEIPLTASVSEKYLNHLNKDQLTAVQKVMTCKDYALILGMPGTGKTMTTAELIKVLVGQGKSVLLTAYTHNALDNILLKLVEQGVDILRLGNPEKVMPSIRAFMPHANPELTSVAAMSEFYDSKMVVGATCYGTNHIVFKRRRFDYCIVDEASQITLPVCIGPLQYADKFILVGDQYQLPPIVRDKKASTAGFSTSLFTMLARNHPDAIAFLEYQYRMNKDIMTISSELVYDNKLKCGNEDVANRTLHIPRFDQGLQSIHVATDDGGKHCHLNDGCWLKDIMDPNRSVIFVDTDSIPATESRPGDKVIQNEEEATLVYQTVEALLQCGLTEEQLAVISVYRTQLRLITHHFAGQRPDLEIATIDKYQGRDKDCVLISLVRSNSKGASGYLLRDWRRLNVAFTRAKSKLILFGSLSTLKHSSLLGNFLNLLEKNQWIYTLPKDAHLAHEMQLPFKSSLANNQSSQHLKHMKNGSPRKVFTGSKMHLDDRPILKDIFNYATQG